MKRMRMCSCVLFLVAMLCVPNVMFSQERTESHATQTVKDIVGIVVDQNGEPVVGASVIESGASRGVVTNTEGQFSLPSNGRSNVKLSISFVGMKPEEVVWKGKRLKIVLDDATTDLTEVVVTGYQTLDRRSLTSAISSVKMDEVLTPDMTTIDQALEGHVPDLMFSQNSGEVGSTARLRVRGTSTLVGNREPIWVLDGFVIQDPVNVSAEELNDPDYINYVGNAISGLNPQDIERIDVLKDAAATALYGTRAANGVIVVTTKQGREGPPSIRFASQTKLITRPHYTDRNINLMNSQERVQFGKDLCDLHYQFPQYMPMVGYEGAYYRFQQRQTTYEQFLSEVQAYETVNTDWFDLLTRDAITTSNTLSLSGGNRNTRYYTSFGYTRENGTVKTQFVERYTGQINVSTTISQRLKANVRMNANVQKKNHLPSSINPLNYAYETTRALPAYNPDGSLFYYKQHGYSVGSGSKTNNLYNYNIINEMNNASSDYNGSTINASAELIYNIYDFNIQLAAAYNRSSTSQSEWFGENTNYVAILKNGEVGETPQTGTSGICELPYGGILNTTNTITENFTARLQANYRHYFDSDKYHLLTGTLGYEVNAYRNNSISDKTRGYFQDRGMQYASIDVESLDDFPLYKEWLGKNHRTLVADKRNTISGYLTLAYEYRNWFTLGLNGRFDASNKFGSRSNEKFLPVWSVSGRWNIKSTLLKEETWLDEWSIRASYGKTGNMLDHETPNLLIRQGILDSYYGENTSTVVAFPNPNLRWEQTATTNIGMEMSFFNSRLSLSGDVWFKHTTDAFSTINVSTVNGVTTYNLNNGTIDNKGFSLYLRGFPVRTRDWQVQLSTVYSWAHNTVRSGANENYSLANYLNGTAIIDGQSIGTFYSYKYLGLNPTSGIPMFDDYQDRRHLLSGKTLAEIVPLVMTASGNRDPKLTGSFYASVKWKQISLGGNFNYCIGRKVRLFNLYTPIVNGVTSDKNVRKEFVDRWTKPGDEKFTDIPALLSPSDPNYASTYSHWCNSESAKIDKIPVFAGNIWTMYDSSDLRVVSGDYLRLSNLVLSYDFTTKQLKNTFLKSLRLGLSMTNVFTICSKKLNGQDPSQAGFTGVNMSTRPSYTFNLNVSF